MELSLHDHIENYLSRIRRVHLNLFYLIGFISFLPFYIHEINGDTVSYIAIARRYAHADLFDAFNGYWSPLISWLLIPFIWLKIPELFAFKIIIGIAGWLSINIMYHIFQRIRISAGSKMIILLLFIPHLLVFIMRLNTPDVVGFTIWLTVVHLMLKLWNKPSYSNKMLLGFLGVLSYLARYYHFYIFTLSLIVFLILVAIKHKKLFKEIFSSFLVFFALTSVWILMIDLKYGEFTPTLALDYNMKQTALEKQIHPGSTGDSLLNLNYENYLITSWEEPAFYKLKEYTPVDTSDSLMVHLKRRLTALKMIMNYFFMESMLILLALVLVLFRINHLNSTQYLLLALSVIYPTGYLLIATEPRYFIFTIFGLLTLSVHILNSRKIHELWMKSLIIILFIGAFLTPFYNLFTHINSCEKVYEDAVKFRQTAELKGQYICASPELFWDGMYLSYHSKAKFRDALKPEKLDELKSILKQNHIRYYYCKESEKPQGFNIIASSNDNVLLQLY